MLAFVVFSLFSSSLAFPTDIKYDHNVSLNWDGSHFTNLDTVDQLSGVDPAMASALKEAINEAMPSYLAALNGTTESTTMSPELTAFFNRIDLVNFHVDVNQVPAAQPAHAEDSHAEATAISGAPGVPASSDDGHGAPGAPGEHSAETTPAATTTEGATAYTTPVDPTGSTPSHELFTDTTTVGTTVAVAADAQHAEVETTTISVDSVATAVLTDPSASTTMVHPVEESVATTVLSLSSDVTTHVETTTAH